MHLKPHLVETSEMFTLLTGAGTATEWPSSAMGVNNVGFAASTTPALQGGNQSVLFVVIYTYQ